MCHEQSFKILKHFRTQKEKKNRHIFCQTFNMGAVEKHQQNKKTKTKRNQLDKRKMKKKDKRDVEV